MRPDALLPVIHAGYKRSDAPRATASGRNTMTATVFVAGAAGAVGRPLCRLLRRAGYAVIGTTRKPSAAAWLHEAGVTPVMLDVFDAAAVSAAMRDAKPDVIIHQLTDLSSGFDPESLKRNADLRRVGTRNLMNAAEAAAVGRVIAQSIAWVYAPGPEPHTEIDPLNTQAEGAAAVSMAGVVALEDAVLAAKRPVGIVLRYGSFYGPGTGSDAPRSDLPAVHVEAAAFAALLAVEKGAAGVYNVAEPASTVSSEKARRELGWDAAFRIA
jgi:nucleoside-diphosphate-sugar epimerase